jgi:hypothetical protein
MATVIHVDPEPLPIEIEDDLPRCSCYGGPSYDADVGPFFCAACGGVVEDDQP